MSLLHRTRTDDDEVIVERDGDEARHEVVEAPPATTRRRERSWTFAPGQLVSLIVGTGFVAVGLIALIRAGIERPLSSPVVDVLTYTHTAWLGLAEVGLGVLLILAGTGAWGRALSVLLGAVMVIGGILVLAETGQLPDELGLEESFGWPLIALGGLVAVAAMALPVWRSHKVVRDDIDLRDERVDVR